MCAQVGLEFIPPEACPEPLLSSGVCRPRGTRTREQAKDSEVSSALHAGPRCPRSTHAQMRFPGCLRKDLRSNKPTDGKTHWSLALHYLFHRHVISILQGLCLDLESEDILNLTQSLKSYCFNYILTVNCVTGLSAFLSHVSYPLRSVSLWLTTDGHSQPLASQI